MNTNQQEALSSRTCLSLPAVAPVKINVPDLASARKSCANLNAPSLLGYKADRDSRKPPSVTLYNDQHRTTPTHTPACNPVLRSFTSLSRNPPGENFPPGALKTATSTIPSGHVSLILLHAASKDLGSEESAKKGCEVALGGSVDAVLSRVG
jgi:hypothetical protein